MPHAITNCPWCESDLNASDHRYEYASYDDSASEDRESQSDELLRHSEPVGPRV